MSWFWFVVVLILLIAGGLGALVSILWWILTRNTIPYR